MGYQVPVLATLCGWGSIMRLKYMAKGTQVLVQRWKAQLGIICGQKANHYKLLFGSRIWRHPITSRCSICNNEGTSLTGNRKVLRLPAEHLKLRLSVWLVKAELLSLHFLCKTDNVQPGATVLATLCGWGSIMCLKYLAKSTQVLVQCWKAQLGIICGQEANYYKLPGFDHEKTASFKEDLPLNPAERLVAKHVRRSCL